MAEEEVSNELRGKFQTEFEEDAEKRFKARKAVWDESDPKREAATHLFMKLTEGDGVAKGLMEKAEKSTLALSRAPLNLPTSSNTGGGGVHIQSFAPTGVTLSSLALAKWTSNSSIEIVGSVPGNNMSWSLTTAGPLKTESVSSELYSSLHPPPNSKFMTVLSSANIAYSYGNHAFLRHSHTHAWIGLHVSEWDANGNRVQTNVYQQNNMWDLTTDHDFSGTGQPNLQANAIPIVDNHTYLIVVNCGGDVESNATSYANLKLSVNAIFVNFN